MAREKPNKLPGSPLFRRTLSLSRLKADSCRNPKKKTTSSDSGQVILASMDYNQVQKFPWTCEREVLTDRAVESDCQPAGGLNVVHLQLPLPPIQLGTHTRARASPHLKLEISNHCQTFITSSVSHLLGADNFNKSNWLSDA